MSAAASLGAWARESGTVTYDVAPLPADAPAAFTIHAESHPSGAPSEYPAHTHPLHELVWVRGGTMTARVGDLLVTVPEGQGLWIPAGVEHAGRLTADVELCDAFFAPAALPAALEGATTLVMTPLLESLLLHLTRRDLTPPARSRAEAVVLDVLEPSAPALDLRLPGDPRIDPIASALLADPADPRDLPAWAREAGLSTRTVSRAFRSATGLPFARWRQMLRVHHAVRLLGEGREVQEVSRILGYSQPSTFIDAFHRVTGRTPGSHLAEGVRKS